MLIYFLKVLENTFIWLNDWGKNLLNKLITEDNFLTKNIENGYRVKIKELQEIVTFWKVIGIYTSDG